MSSVYLQNDGNGKWTVMNLPFNCQTGPIKAFYVDDVNSDGNLDFLYAGNHFPTEVETARYDGLFPGVCLGDGKGNFTCETIIANGKMEVMDVRDIRKIQVSSGSALYLFSLNDGPCKAIKF